MDNFQLSQMCLAIALTQTFVLKEKDKIFLKKRKKKKEKGSPTNPYLRS